ncbi:MAG TPA: hypothetical protein EYQ60_02370 [Myxococcales bacterium]|nr:hypothetical protein [Myxococcales bacterium]HIK85183.1 hypothetical protein [Myxococcales bacterium]
MIKRGTKGNDESGTRFLSMRIGRIVLAPILAAVILGLVVGCVGPRLKAGELPDQPIAYVHWTKQDAKKRSGLFEKSGESARAPASRRNSARFQEAEIQAYLQGEKNVGLQAMLAKAPGRLMLVWPNTGVVKRLEAAPLGSRPLAWSSDHKRLLFVSAHRGGKDQLYEYDVDREELRTVTVGPAEYSRGDYGVDDQIVLLRSQRPLHRGASEQTVHLTGAAGRLGAPIAEAISPGAIRITPDGRHLVYEHVRARPRRGVPTVYESMIATQMIEERAEERLLLRGREPTLTPDGEWIVFASPSSAGYRLRRIRPDGTSRVPISPGGSEERMPSVSPDGQFIVFVQMANGFRKLSVRRFDGRGERLLVEDGWSEFPVW